MTRQERTRRLVARYVWRSNPASQTMAAVAVGLAQLLDRGRPEAARPLRTCLSHLRDCDAEPTALDEIRARYCRTMLDVLGQAPG